MGGLPDDALATIFSYLPPLMLLDSVPLVCKRWHQLSKHPDSWRNVNLFIEFSTVDEEVKKLARFAKVAPYLNRIDFRDARIFGDEHNEPRHIEYYRKVKSIVDALLQKKTIVKSLHTFRIVTREMRDLSKDMLKAFASSLREVFIPLEEPPVGDPVEFHEDLNNLLTLVSNIPHLQSLGFVINDIGHLPNYRGQLGKGCPTLKKFKVFSTAVRGKHCWNSLIFDILGCKKESLREVEFNFALEPVVNYEAALRSCQNLVRCKVPFEMLPVIEHMSNLRSLEICGSTADVITPEKIAVLLKFIKESRVMENITELSLNERLFGIKVADSLRLFSALSVKCKEIQIFRMKLFIHIQHVLNILFSSMKHIHTVFIQDSIGLSGNDIDLLSKSSKLKYLKITNIMFYAKSDLEKTKNAIRMLQSSRPQLVVVFNSEESISSDTENNYISFGLNANDENDDEEDGDAAGGGNGGGDE